MKEILENIATNRSWVFEHGRSDYQNLFSDMDLDTVHLFLDPVQTTAKVNDYGVRTEVEYSGQFMMVEKSEFDENYKEKYDNHIEPMDANLKLLEGDLGCQGLTFNIWRYIDGINMLDENMDGIIVTFNVTMIPSKESQKVVVDSNWILKNGTWDDGGVWEDTAIWND